ncbi:MAG: DUF5818 domain-containing protein [Nitrospinales bacterium]
MKFLSIVFVAAALFLVPASGASLEKSPDAGSAKKIVCAQGRLTDEGVECPALRASDGALYTLIGDLKGFKKGDSVYVCGTVPEMSFCMQGVTLAVVSIDKEAPPDRRDQ